MKKKWEFYKTNEELVNKISEKYKISKLVTTVLVNRNIVEDEDISIFLNPTRNDFHDPFLMPDMEKAVNRIMKAIKTKEKTIIYGDYDVDGITSITVLKQFLKERGLDADYYIPNRLTEGYGLNKEAIKEISDKGYKLIITVDCGISSNEEVDYAYELGMEVIITDHHEPLEKIPKALAVIDCKREDNKYPYNGLAGVGVAFKLAQALSQKYDLDSKEYLKYLDIVCVGTISDIVPLIDENRVIAKLGLMLLSQTKNIGLKSIIASSGYKVVNSTSVSFGIAPRINACGRMGHETDALDLFLTNDIKQAQKLTDTLNEYNKERQSIEKNIYEEAIKLIKESNSKDRNTLVIGAENWHHGVIGIVASKITDLYFKPTILLSYEGDEAKGSGRSIPGFDLHNALCESSEYLEKYGGHEMAVGLSLKRKNVEDFKNKFDQIAKDNHTEDILPILSIDKEITLKEITVENVKSLLLLEPYGEANKMPLFVYRNLKIDSIRVLSEGKHIKLTLKDKNTIIEAIGFNMGEYGNEFLIGDKIDVAGYLELNSFNGVENVQINIKDIRKSY
mgnify:CR=1 FL=1